MLLPRALPFPCWTSIAARFMVVGVSIASALLADVFVILAPAF